MRKEMKGQFKKRLALLLAVVMAFSIFAVVDWSQLLLPEAKASSGGNYQVRVYMNNHNTDSDSDFQWCNVSGVDQSGSSGTICTGSNKSGEGYFDEPTGSNYYSNTIYTPYFPTSFNAYWESHNCDKSDYGCNVYIQVYYNGGWQNVMSAGMSSSENKTGNATYSCSCSGSTSTRPSLNSITASASTTAVTLNATGGAAKTVSLSATAYDQFGVKWYTCSPSFSIVTNSGYTNSVSGSTLSVGPTNATLGNKTVKVRATYSGKTSDVSITLTPTYKVSFNSTTNGGTGSYTAGTIVCTGTSGSYTIPASYTPTKTPTKNWAFNGWATTSSATSGVMPNGSNTITVDNYNDTVYATYKHTTFAEYYYYTSSGARTSTEKSSVDNYNTLTNTTVSVAVPTPPATFTTDGVKYTFKGWVASPAAVSALPTMAIASNATSANQTVQDATHKYSAVYQSDSVYLTYELGDATIVSGSFSEQSDSHFIVAGDYTNAINDPNRTFTFTVNPDNVQLTRPGMDHFLGWRTDGDMQKEEAEYEDGDSYTVTKNSTLYATFYDARYAVGVYDYDRTELANENIRYNRNMDLPAKQTGSVVDHFDATAHYFFDSYVNSDPANGTISGQKILNVKAAQEVTPLYRRYPHTWKIDTVVQEATCGQPGIVNRHCTVCGYTENGHTTEKLGHQTQLFDVKAATCTTDGALGREVCMVCYKVKCYACEANGVDDPFVTLVTETVNGVKKKVCPVCGGVYDEVINPAVPAYGEFNEQGKRVHVFDYEGAYTLDDSGNKVYKCLHCDRTVTVYASTGLVKVAEVPATCTTEGCEAYYTDNEGHYYTDSNGYNEVDLEDLVIPTLSSTGQHAWTDVAASEPSCTEPGYAAGTQVCSLCGAYSEDIIPASHVMSELNAAVEPTCTATGNIAYYYCSRCDQYFEDAEGVKRISNSFTKDHKAYCADCGAIVSVTKDAEDNWFCAADESHTNLMNTYVFLDKVAHTMPEGAAAQTIIPTCLGKGGRYFGACTVCGQEIWTNETDALGHNLQWVDGVAATCTKTGKEGYYKCVNGCGTWYRDIRDGEEEDDIEALPNAIEGKKIITEQAIIEKLPHTLTAVDPVESTCTETGNIAYWVCDVCGAYFADEDGETEITDKDSVIIGKKDHEFTVIIEQVEGTCQVYARTTYQCANCDATHTERGNKGDHNYVIEQQAATCGADGYTREKCTVCGKTRNEATLAATGNHTPGEWIEEGSVRRTNCTVCGAEMVEPLNPETPTNPDQPATPSGEKCPKCGLIHEGRTGIFVEGGLYCRLVGAIRKLFKK